MMSMTTLKSASQASGYYSKDNYYTKEETPESLANASWYGKGANVLGLTEQQFDPSRFKELLEGNIDENNSIGRISYDENGVAVTQHRPGVDLTFSAPKSVSILAEVFKDKEVREAHEEAVKSSLDLIEKKYAQSRISIDGNMQKVDTENLIVALFSHNNSRDLDPQTHTHAVVMNATLNQKGEWTALSNESIYRNQKLIGAIYNAELARNLKDLGYELNFKENGNFDIAGIDQSVIDEFSQRRKAMLDSAEQKGIDLSAASAKQKEVIALDTRTAKKDVTQEKLDQDWSNRAEGYGLTIEKVSELFEEAKSRSNRSKATLQTETQQPLEQSDNQRPGKGNKTQPETLQQPLEQPDSERPGKGTKARSEATQQPLEQPGNQKDETLESKSSLVDKFFDLFKKGDHGKEINVDTVLKEEERSVQKDLNRGVKEAVYYAIGHHTEREMMIHREDIETTALKQSEGKFSYKEVNEEVDRLLKANILVEGDKGRITTKRLAHNEVWSINHVKEERHSVEKILNLDQVKSELAEREKLQKFNYTEGQRESIYSIFTTDSRYHAVNGLAGTGKTTMLLALNKISEKNGYLVKGMAGTGVAAKNLEDETGIPSTTIAMFKFQESRLQNTLKQSEQSIDRKHEIWVVDESSFASQESFSEILKMSKAADSRIVFLGDKLQLQAIAAGKPFELLQDYMSNSKMEDINRQKTQDLKDVVALITAKNTKGEITLSENQKAFELLDQQGKVQVHEQEELHKELVKAYMQNDKKKRDNSLIITPFNKDRKILNDMIRQAKKDNEELTGQELKFMIFANKNLTKAEQTNKHNYAPGDVIRFNKTYSPGEHKFQKDEYYTVVGSTKNELILRDKNGVEQPWNTKNKNQVEVYQKDDRELMVGDKIKINRSNGEFKNGEKYEFKGIKDNEVILNNEKGEEKIMPKDDFKHWDHGYANTIYSSQGLTKSNIFMLINSDKLSNNMNNSQATKNLGKIFGNRAFYVGVTRASNELKIFTHDKEVARSAVGYEQDKTSYVQDFASHEEAGKQFEQHNSFDMEI